jgi:hypothetical protein
MSKTVPELLIGVLEQVGVVKRSGNKDRTSTDTTMSARMDRNRRPSCKAPFDKRHLSLVLVKNIRVDAGRFPPFCGREGA